MPYFVPPAPEPMGLEFVSTEFSDPIVDLKDDLEPTRHDRTFPHSQSSVWEQNINITTDWPSSPENFAPEFSFSSLLQATVSEPTPLTLPPLLQSLEKDLLHIKETALYPITHNDSGLNPPSRTIFDQSGINLSRNPDLREHPPWETTPEVISTHAETTSSFMVTPDLPNSPPTQPPTSETPETQEDTQTQGTGENPPMSVSATPENFLPENSETPLISEPESNPSTDATTLGEPMSVGYQPEFQITPIQVPALDNLTPEKVEFGLHTPVEGFEFQELGFSQPQNLQVNWFNKNQTVGPIQYLPITRIVAQERGGEAQEFDLEENQPDREVIFTNDEDLFPDETETFPTEEEIFPEGTETFPDVEDNIPDFDETLQDIQEEETQPTQPETPETLQPPPPQQPRDLSGILEIYADRQEYNEKQRVVTAYGNVLVRFARGVLSADRVQINLPNRFLRGVGNVALRRGDQTLRGEEFEYQLIQDEGVVYNASGEIYQPTSGRDLDFTPAGIRDNDILPPRPLSDRLLRQQPISNITVGEGFNFSVGSSDVTQGLGISGAGASGDIKRLRFEADYLEFDSQGWWAENVRMTNDPFSPPELEIRADTVEFNRLNEFQDEILSTNSRVVFDQGFSLPIFQDRILLDRRPDRGDGLFNIGFDDDERGGLFIDRRFTLLRTPNVFWTVTPQYFVQRAIDTSPLDPSVFGLQSRLEAIFDERTSLVGSAEITSFDFEEFETNFRSSVRLRHLIGPLERPHTLTGEFSFRDRLFNGSLGFQTVQTSFGAVLTSPVIPLGDTGINLTYQGGIQAINADTDRLDLLATPRDNNRITLTRFQGAFSLSRGFSLWKGEPLPPTPTEGLRYTSTPVTPYLSLSAGLRGLASIYSSGDTQQALTGSLSLSGQFGHFSKPFLDYTGFNISYSQSLVGELSPFLFDRIADSQTLSFGITQQIYGPFRIGFQTSLNLDTGQEISTNYTLEYSRRTHGVILRYNPVLGLGSVLIRIADFNWVGTGEPFGGSGVRPVVDGVTQ